MAVGYLMMGCIKGPKLSRVWTALGWEVVSWGCHGAPGALFETLSFENRLAVRQGAPLLATIP
jgi:hypothetical protein